MGLAYLFALVVGLGILLLQVVLGGRGDGHGGGDAHAGAGGHAAGGHGHGHDNKESGAGGAGGLVALVLSLRFWIFALMAFGLSGSLLHVFALASPVATAIIAIVAGLSSGLFAAVAFRLVRQASSSTDTPASGAVGRVGRVVVACSKGAMGQVRVELAGQSVDYMATTDEDDIQRGDPVLVQDMREGVAHVSRPPPEIR